MTNERKDVIGVNCLENEDGKELVDPDGVKQRWKDYMEWFLTIENDWNGFDGEDVYEGPKKAYHGSRDTDCN